MEQDKNYVLIVYYYADNDEFCYSISPDMYNLNIQLQYAYYRYRLANGEYNVAIMEASELYYLEQRETTYDNFHYYAGETQKAIEECDIINLLKEIKERKDNEKY